MRAQKSPKTLQIGLLEHMQQYIEKVWRHERIHLVFNGRRITMKQEITAFFALVVFLMAIVNYNYQPPRTSTSSNPVGRDNNILPSFPRQLSQNATISLTNETHIDEVGQTTSRLLSPVLQDNSPPLVRHNERTAPAAVDVVIYNRVHKCGSRTLLDYVEKLSRLNGFHQVHSSNYHHRRLRIDHQVRPDVAKWWAMLKTSWRRFLWRMLRV